VPEILLSGNHAEVARWRRQQSLLRTAQSRPDLLAKAELTDQDRKLLQKALGTPAVQSNDLEHSFNMTTQGREDPENL
jgi:tRNA (guanine37-N1)-methyltransferase